MEDATSVLPSDRFRAVRCHAVSPNGVSRIVDWMVAALEVILWWMAAFAGPRVDAYDGHPAGQWPCCGVLPSGAAGLGPGLRSSDSGICLMRRVDVVSRIQVNDCRKSEAGLRAVGLVAEGRLVRLVSRVRSRCLRSARSVLCSRYDRQERQPSMIRSGPSSPRAAES
jgi:hypothetical protein